MPDINYGQILEALNNKTDRDLGNLSAEGRVAGGGLAFPSSNRISLTITQNVLTAPANGWVCADLRCGNEDGRGWFYLTNQTRNYRVASGKGADVNICFFMPVFAGDEFNITYDAATNSINGYNFIYAEGSNN